jgi:hypothetical protein
MNKDQKLMYFLGQLQMYFTMIIRNNAGCSSDTFNDMTEMEVFFNQSMREIFDNDQE